MTVDSGAELAAEAVKAQPVKKSTAKPVAKPDATGQAIETLQREVQSLATLIHSMRDDAPDGTVRGSKINNLSARLEKLEQQVQGENGLLTMDQANESTFRVLRLELDTLTERAAQLTKAFEGYSQPVAVETVMSEIQQLRDHVDAVSKMQPGLDTVTSSVRQSLTDYIDSKVDGLAPMVQQLTAGLTTRVDRLSESIQSVAKGVGERATSPAAPSAGLVYEKVLALMDEVDHIAKGRTASGGGGVHYKFRGIEDAQNAVGAAMRKVRVLLQPEVVSWDYGQVLVEGTDSKGNAKQVWWATSRLTMRYTFVAPEDGSRFTIEMVGEGKDNSDKSASKAASMACKYALFQALMIPFEQVDESDAQNDAIAQSTRADIHYAENQAQQAAGQQAAPEMTPDQKAATLVRWVREVQSLPGAEALPKLQKAKEKAEANGLNDLMVEDVPVHLHINTALQLANTSIQKAAKPGAAQGVSRREQQAGEGARAAAEATSPDATATQESSPARVPDAAEYEAALAALRGESGDLTDEAITQAEAIVVAFERRQA